jgi:uncharacterized RDD family membrane protein YckC
MSTQSPPTDRVEFETPPYGAKYILLMVLLAFLILGLQIGATTIWIWQRQGANPTRVPLLGQTASRDPIPGCTVLFKGEVWSAMSMDVRSMPGATSGKPSPPQLIAFNEQTGKSRDTGIRLQQPPLGMQAIDHRLWCVAEGVVYRVENGEAFSRHPRRMLVQPSRPFIYKGLLAVIDKNKNGGSSLLTWKDEEWFDEGSVDVPIPSSASAWFTPEIRVAADGDRFFVFYTEGQNILFREGFNLNPDWEPVPASALHPENVDNLYGEIKLTPGQAAATTRVVTPPSNFPALQAQGWTNLPVATNWQTMWEVAAINGEPWIFTIPTPYNDQKLQSYKRTGNAWVNVTPKFPPLLKSMGVNSGPTGYLAADESRLYKLNGTDFEQVTTGPPMSERLRSVLGRTIGIAAYLLIMSVLVVGTTRLMRAHRNPQYSYGKQTVTQASVCRRAMARGIDLLITVFPPIFWFMVLLDEDVATQLRQQSNQFGLHSAHAIIAFSIYGTWMGVTLVLSVMEGIWGYTPGKWLLRIRTLRTTLRPCGILRAFARELLVYADGLFLLTWLPGVLLIAFTPHWQRLGDLTADTVVINDPRR